jgi:hypothetical protein
LSVADRARRQPWRCGAEACDTLRHAAPRVRDSLGYPQEIRDRRVRQTQTCCDWTL